VVKQCDAGDFCCGQDPEEFIAGIGPIEAAHTAGVIKISAIIPRTRDIDLINFNRIPSAIKNPEECSIIHDFNITRKLDFMTF
jgi:hypothetical protein